MTVVAFPIIARPTAWRGHAENMTATANADAHDFLHAADFAARACIAAGDREGALREIARIVHFEPAPAAARVIRDMRTTLAIELVELLLERSSWSASK